MRKETKILLMISALFTLAMGLSGVFVNIFFWRQTSNFVVIVIYNLMHYVFGALTFIVAGFLAKKKNGIWSLRLGLLFFALFFSLIIWVGDRGIYYIYPLGILFGIAAGFYWLAYNTLSFDFTDTNNRDTFNGFNGCCAGIAGAVAPITSAFIISRFQGVKGYNIVFAITLSLFVALILLSLLLRCENYSDRLDLSMIFKKNCEDWGTIRRVTMFWGFRDVTIGFIINILIIETTGSELSLGKFSLMAALVSSGSFALVQRIIKPGKRRLSAFIGASFSFISVWGLFVGINYYTILAYILTDAFFLPFYLIQQSSSTFNIINKLHQEEKRIEFVINRELMLGLGRVISSILLIVLMLTFERGVILRYYILFVAAAPILSAYFLSKLGETLEGKC